MTKVSDGPRRSVLHRAVALHPYSAGKEDESINGMLKPRRHGPRRRRTTLAPCPPDQSIAQPEAHAAPWPAQTEGGTPEKSPGTRALAPWLVVAVLLTTSVFRAQAAFAETPAGALGTVNSSDGLNLRSGPGKTFDVIAVIPNGAQLVITGAALTDNWLPVSYNTQAGFVDAIYVSADSPAPIAATAAAAPTPPPALPLATATPPAPTAGAATVLPPDGLNLRSGPGTSYSVVATLPGGATVTITGPAKDGWAPVTSNGQSGWVDGAYVSADGASPMITANAVGSSGGATVSASAGSTNSATRDSAASATPSPTPPPPAAGQTKLAWPSTSRKISTVFSPSHLGIDIDEFNAPTEAAIASAAGTVTFAGGDACCSYGLYVMVDHGNGLSTLYAHLASISVQKGQVVGIGQKLGIVGCTGKCTGTHIHYEVRVNDKQVDPLRYLPPPWNIE